MAGEYTRMNKSLVSAQVEDEVMRFIRRECKVGDKLPGENRLAERFGTSRSTIREVMKGLEMMGIVQIRHGSGTYVSSLRAVEDDPLHLGAHKDKYRLALELFDVRLMLEPEIAAQAAQMRSDEEALEVIRLCDEVERIYRAGEDHTQMDLQLHSYIARCSGNSIVQTLVPLIQSGVVTFCNITQRQLMQETIDTHRAVAEAIRDRDSVGARCAMTAHLAVNRTFILRQMRQREDKEV